MTRLRDSDGAHLWAVVTATVRPLPGRPAKAVVDPPAPQPHVRAHHMHAPAPEGRVASRPAHPKGPPQPIEPRRRRQLERDRGQIAGQLDLHGHTEVSARDVLIRFILARHAEGGRSVLVVTGKGALGEGVLRRRVPDWLSEPPLRTIVAGVSEAHRRHGGEGALYVALKRRQPR